MAAVAAAWSALKRSRSGMAFRKPVTTKNESSTAPRRMTLEAARVYDEILKQRPRGTGLLLAGRLV